MSVARARANVAAAGLSDMIIGENEPTGALTFNPDRWSLENAS